jgi:DNA-binding response OmpR family regulator
MHMRSVLVAANDDHTRAWIHRAMAGMDITIDDVSLSELTSALQNGDRDLVIVDGGTVPQDVVDSMEGATSLGARARVLVLVEDEALPGLRLPVRIISDFVVRGATSEEMGARARMLLWPGQERPDQDLIQVDDLVLNLATYQAHTASGPIDFTYQEYALFAYLVTHPNRAYSRDLLLKRVWDQEYFGGTRTVDVHIRRVRAKIGPELGRRLETVRGVGYLWND